MAKSKVVLDYKFEHTNRDLDELLTCRRGAPGCLNRVRPEGPIRRTRERGGEWEPIKILLEGGGNSEKMSTASNTRL
jgi:hypothetical protein